MRHSIFILLTLIVASCTGNSTQVSNYCAKIDPEQADRDESVTYNEYLSDSVSIDVRNEFFDHFVVLTIGDYQEEYDLTALHIPTKTPEVLWVNDEFACMVTWWSMSFSRHIFIPLNQSDDLIYIDKDIEQMDSINNNVVYVDSIYSKTDNVEFKIENLVTRKFKSLKLSINEQNNIYPYYDSIELSKNNLTMITATEKINVDITEISK